jgi:iron complex outermembrane receptor protein
MSMIRIPRAVIPAAVLLACSPAAWAQDAAAAEAEQKSTTALETVRIEGQRQPYRTLSATGAMKTDTPIRDMAQSVRVLSADLLADAGVTKLADALDLSSGVAKQSNLGGLWDSYAMRGFTGDASYGSDYMVNGFNYSRGYNGVRDQANTQSVEVLKGPASALYGRGEPGGTVNMTTKKPLFLPQYVLELGGGSYNAKRATADLTGPLTDTIAYRLNVAAEGADSFRDHVSSERYLLSPSFLWMVGEDTTISYELEVSRQLATFDRGVVAVNGKLGLVPRSAFYGEPGDGRHKTETTGNQIFIQHYFNDDWSIQTGLSYRESSLKGVSTEARFLQPDNRTLVNQRRNRDYEATDVSGRFEVLGKLRGAGLVHNVLFGVDGYKFTDDRDSWRVANAGTIDIYNPVYGGIAPEMTRSIWTHEEQNSKAIYGQDQIDIGKQWKALVGFRYDSYDQTVLNRRGNATIEQSLSKTTPRVGLVYQPDKVWSVYATASRSFKPNNGTTSSFQAFPAETGKSVEGGAKFNSPDGKITGTLAVYKISKNNVLTPDPADPNNFYVAAGLVESKGVELDVSGEIAAGLRLSSSYAFTNAKVTEDNNAFLVGRQLTNVPKHSANVMLVQAFTLGGNASTLGVGVNYVSAREGAVAPIVPADDFKLPAYTTVKLIASYNVAKNWRLSADIDNLFDKEFYTSSYSQAWVYPGNGRKFNMTVQYKF